MNQIDKDVILKLKKITVISTIFMIIEIIGGYYANSIAIFADAFHLLSDVLAYIISLYAVLLSSRKGQKYLTFGYEKAQPLGALINVAIIWLVTGELFIEATMRIIHHSRVEEPTYMLLTSVFGLGCNLYIMKVLHSDQHAGGHHGCSHDHGHNHQHPHPHSHSQHSHIPIEANSIREHHVHSDKCSHQAKPQQAHKHTSGCNHNHDDHNNQQIHKSQQPQHHEHGNSCSHKHQQIVSQIEDIPDTSHKICSHPHNLISGQQIYLPSIASDEQMKVKQQKRQFQNINIEAAYIHILTDIILSIGVIISASIIYFFAPDVIWSYWQLADPLCTYFFSIMAIYTTIPIAKESIILLLDGCERGELITEIQDQLREDNIVREVVNLRVWSVNRGKHYGALKVRTIEGDNRGLKRIFSSRGITGFIQIEQEQLGLQAQQ